MLTATVLTVLNTLMPPAIGGVVLISGTGPSFDCLKASTSAEELVCADKKLSALDRRLAKRFAAAMATAKAQDAGSEDAIKFLRATQRGWIKGRDDCWKSDDLHRCVMDNYLLREGELVAGWMLQEPASAVTYTCDGNPANEITALFFDTELPSVRLEYGDSIETGSNVPTASGSKYAARFGRSIWTKGDNATVVWEEGVEMNCTRSAG